MHRPPRRLALLALALACTTPPSPAGEPASARAELPAQPSAESTLRDPPPPLPDPTNTDPTNTDSPPPSSPTTAPALDSAHACTHDRDCIASCSQGAVHRAWYQRMFPGGEACEDGCTRKGTGAPRCESGTCVAYHNGAPDPLCTGKPDLVREPQRPGPAHACARDSDCRLSCTYGAVRTAWYDLADRRREECRDGCSAKGMGVRCEDGRCLALRHGEPYPGCTERPIWRDE